MKITLPERGLEALFGPYDQNIKYLESVLSVRVGGRGGELTIEGDEADVAVVEKILKDYGQLFDEGRRPSDAELRAAFKQIAEDRTASLRELFAAQKRINPAGRKQVTARSPNQSRYLEAIEKHDIVFGIGPAGTGKCVARDSLVLTDRGMLEIGALGAGTRPRDYTPLGVTVHGLGGPEETSHVYNGGESETLRITTCFGYSIEVTPEHPLLVLGEGAQLVWRRADELGRGDAVALQRGQRQFGTRTAVDFVYRPRGPHDRSSKPVRLDFLDEDFAYVMGALTGDGCFAQRGRIVLASADDEILEAFSALAARFSLKVFPNGQGRPSDRIIASTQLYQLFEHLGMSLSGARAKRLPHAIMAAPEEIVAAFLRGLFDTDGTVEKRDGVVSLSSVSEALIREVQVVLLNFGIVASKAIKRGRYRGEPHVSHLLTLAGAEAERFHEVIGFGLERKRARRQVRTANPNVDVVPHLGALIGEAARGTTLTHAERHSFDDYRRERRRPSYAKLGAIVGLLEARGASDEPLEQMRGLLNRRLLFAKIVSIEPSRTQVYDLTVPGTHSFVANGFVNHNTYLAVAMAVQYLMAKRVNRIILARPAVEAGEKLGFLPGDLQDKVDPYLRPLYDALFDVMDFERVTRFLEKRVIEIAPLAFMRGRAQPRHSRVLTPTGWREIGSLEPRDHVIGSDGRPTRVLGVYPQGKKPVYRVTMTDGSATLACAEHLWAVRTPEDKRDGKPPRVLETREMIGNLRCFHQHRYELPVLASPVQWPRREVPVDPYALGLLLGDGCITDKTSPAFATAEPEMVVALGGALAPLGVSARQKSDVDYTLTYPGGGRGGVIIRNPLTQALRGLGLAGTRSATKFVPEVYLYNDSSVRLAVLQGLLDTDGGPVTQEGRTCRIQFVTTSARLKDDVLFLVRSLGGVAYWRKRGAEGRRPGFARGREVPYRSDAYVMDIRLPEELEPFRLGRKAKVYREHGAGRPMRFLKSIEPAGVEETVCISVAAPDSLYVTDDFILTHNTLADAFIILDEAQNTTSEQMKMFLTRIGFGSKAVITGDVTQIDLPSGRKSGLVEAQRVVSRIEGIEFVEFTDQDVVRHQLVQMIIRAYDEHSKKISI